MKEDDDKNEDDYKYVEPPELREAGVPPLRKQLNWFVIGVAVILVIVLIFAVYFYYSNN
jgi:uncharacterized integral membrane protein